MMRRVRRRRGVLWYVDRSQSVCGIRGDLRSTCSTGDADIVSPSATTTARPRATPPSTITVWCSAPSRSRMMSCSKSLLTKRCTHRPRETFARPRASIKWLVILYIVKTKLNLDAKELQNMKYKCSIVSINILYHSSHVKSLCFFVNVLFF